MKKNITLLLALFTINVCSAAKACIKVSASEQQASYEKAYSFCSCYLRDRHEYRIGFFKPCNNVIGVYARCKPFNMEVIYKIAEEQHINLVLIEAELKEHFNKN